MCIGGKDKSVWFLSFLPPNIGAVGQSVTLFSGNFSVKQVLRTACCTWALGAVMLFPINSKLYFLIS